MQMYTLRDSREHAYARSRDHTSPFPPAPARGCQIMTRAACFCATSRGSRGSPVPLQASTLHYILIQSDLHNSFT